MNPMMALAALRGCMAVRSCMAREVRVVAAAISSAPAIYDGWSCGSIYYPPYVGVLNWNMAMYEPAELSDFKNWHDVTEEMLDQLMP